MTQVSHLRRWAALKIVGSETSGMLLFSFIQLPDFLAEDHVRFGGLVRNAIRIKFFDDASRAFKCRPATGSLWRLGRSDRPCGLQTGTRPIDRKELRVVRHRFRDRNNDERSEGHILPQRVSAAGQDQSAASSSPLLQGLSKRLKRCVAVKPSDEQDGDVPSTRDPEIADIPRRGRNKFCRLARIGEGERGRKPS